MRYVGGIWDRGRSSRHLTFVVGHWRLWGSGMWAVELKDGRFVGKIGIQLAGTRGTGNLQTTNGNIDR